MAVYLREKTTDWSLDDKRAELRKWGKGREWEIAALFNDTPIKAAFVQECGIEQFTYCGFVDWLIENCPYEVAQALKTISRGGWAGKR